MNNNDMQFYMKRRDYNVSELQSKMVTGRKINNLRDDPLAAAHSVRLQSSINRIGQFQKNASYVDGRYREVEGYMQEVMDIYHRLREIAVQGANGTYSQEERNNMAYEVNELVNELVRIANATGDSGIMLFGGSDTKGAPFVTAEGRVPGIDHAVVKQVVYTGNVEPNMVEIADSSVINSTFPGNKVFWAENQKIFAANGAENYVVQQDGVITIDGVNIALQSGDNVYSIIQKINDSNTAVKATLDPVTNGMILSSTTPHQIWLDEPAEQTILKDLGLLAPGGNKPPENIHPDAMVAGGSLFDTAIQLRDNLLSGDYELIGTQSLAQIDTAEDTLLKNLTDLGAQSKRLEITQTRLSKLELDYTQTESRTADLDMTEAITELKMYEYLQKASYQTAGKILQPSLMDFLR